MSSIFGSPRRFDPLRIGGMPSDAMHLDIVNDGQAGPLAHTSAHVDVRELVRANWPGVDETWRRTVLRVLRRRRNAVARAMQRWACRLDRVLLARAGDRTSSPI